MGFIGFTFHFILFICFLLLCPRAIHTIDNQEMDWRFLVCYQNFTCWKELMESKVPMDFSNYNLSQKNDNVLTISWNILGVASGLQEVTFVLAWSNVVWSIEVVSFTEVRNKKHAKIFGWPVLWRLSTYGSVQFPNDQTLAMLYFYSEWFIF